MNIAERIIEAQEDRIRNTGQMSGYRIYLGHNLVVEFQAWVEERLYMRNRFTVPARTDGALGEFMGMPIFEVAIDDDHFFVA